VSFGFQDRATLTHGIDNSCHPQAQLGGGTNRKVFTPIFQKLKYTIPVLPRWKAYTFIAAMVAGAAVVLIFGIE
jgi:hypothetical protein